MEILFTALAVAVIFLAVGAAFTRRHRGLRRAAIALAGACFAVALALALVVPRFGRRLQTGYSNNVAVTEPDPEFAELKTRLYAAPPAKVFEAAAAIAGELPGWKLVSRDAAAGSLDAEKKVLGFTDDVHVEIRAENPGSRVDVRSRSRVGKGDFGENRRHVAELLTALDARMR